MRLWLSALIASLLLAACAAPTPAPRPSASIATQRPFPTFGPTRTRTPTATPRVTVTATAEPSAMPNLEPGTPPGVADAAADATNKPIGALATKRPANAAGKLTRAELAVTVRQALIDAGVPDPKVYWFTFDEGDREQALMIQYASPLRWQPGYVEMLHTAQATLGQYFLRADPPLYSAFIAATDITGTSDAVVRLRRSAVEKLARNEIGVEDFVNNYFEPVQLAVKCSPESCTAKMATPFVFHFKFPFPTPTPKP